MCSNICMYVSRKNGVMKSKNNSARRDVRMQKVWKFCEKFLQHDSSQFKHCSQPSWVTNSYLAREYVSFYHHISLQVSCSSPGVPIKKKISSGPFPSSFCFCFKLGGASSWVGRLFILKWVHWISYLPTYITIISIWLGLQKVRFDREAQGNPAGNRLWPC